MIPKGFLREKRILLVIAHPDDEAMFFGPLLLAAKESKAVVGMLCLSTGNADGLGVIRAAEMMQSAAYFGVDCKHVEVLEHRGLQDGFNKQWSASLVASIVEKSITSFNPDTIITFDEDGVSGHPNHISTYKGVLLASVSFQGSREFLKLDSTGFCRKYAGALDMFFSLWIGLYVVVNFNIIKSYSSMRIHYSQFVWYRRLFILFSRYSYVNTFSLMS